jgi:hypothetical protein
MSVSYVVLRHIVTFVPICSIGTSSESMRRHDWRIDPSGISLVSKSYQPPCWFKKRVKQRASEVSVKVSLLSTTGFSHPGSLACFRYNHCHGVPRFAGKSSVSLTIRGRAIDRISVQYHDTKVFLRRGNYLWRLCHRLAASCMPSMLCRRRYRDSAILVQSPLAMYFWAANFSREWFR